MVSMFLNPKTASYKQIKGQGGGSLSPVEAALRPLQALGDTIPLVWLEQTDWDICPAEFKFELLMLLDEISRLCPRGLLWLSCLLTLP